MQISRLFEIVILLLDRETVTAAELAGHFGVSPRTIYRDVEALCQAGIPVYATQGKNGGIRLMESYVMKKSLLSREEQSEIEAALQSLNAMGATQGEGLLAKWRALFGKGEGDWVAVDFSDWSQLRQSELLLIKEAILSKKVLRFTYYGGTGERTEREAEPLQLWFKSRAWYVRAFCRLRGQERLFKLTRMKDIRLPGESFVRRERAEPPPVREGHPFIPPVFLKLWINGSQAYRVYDEFDESQIERQPDGHFRISAAYPEDEWVYGFLMSFGPYLKVLSPARIQCILKEKLEKMSAYYSET